MACSCGHERDQHVNGYCRATRTVQDGNGRQVSVIECGCAAYRDGTTPKDGPDGVSIGGAEVMYDGRQHG